MPDQRDAVLRTIRGLRESPGSKEDAILKEQQIALQDPDARAFVDTFYFDADRAASLERYLSSGFPDDVIDTIRRHFGDRTDLSICEVGAGNGFLAAALVRAGYTSVDILEPATQQVTGTGFLKSLPEFAGISIFSDLDEWYSSPKVYDLVLTNACIHHFENPAVVASQIRLKVRDGAMWLAFWEYFAFDYEDALSQINNHRHAVLYGLYEWPYSPELYALTLGLSGFARGEVATTIPHGRRKLDPLRFAYREIWRLLCLMRVSWPAYTCARFLIRHGARRHLRYVDAAYMAFRARPIRWRLVADGYQRPTYPR